MLLFLFYVFIISCVFAFVYFVKIIQTIHNYNKYKNTNTYQTNIKLKKCKHISKTYTNTKRSKKSKCNNITNTITYKTNTPVVFVRIVILFCFVGVPVFVFECCCMFLILFSYFDISNKYKQYTNIQQILNHRHIAAKYSNT